MAIKTGQSSETDNIYGTQVEEKQNKKTTERKTHIRTTQKTIKKKEQHGPHQKSFKVTFSY